MRLYKVGMTWPMEPQGLEKFAQGLDLIILVEEKRGLMEGQVKEMLYGQANAPRIIGKHDEQGQPMFLSSGALDPNQIAQVIGHRILSHMADDKLVNRVAAIDRFVQSAREIKNRHYTHALLLPRLPAQHRHESARRFESVGGDRLPFPCARHGSQHVRLHANGRRRRFVDGHGAVHESKTRIPKYWRRNLFSFRFAWPCAPLPLRAPTRHSKFYTTMPSR